MEKPTFFCLIVITGVLFTLLICHPVHAVPSKDTDIWIYNFTGIDADNHMLIRNFAISFDGHYIAAGANAEVAPYHSVVYYFDREKQRLLWKTPLYGGINNLVMSPDGSKIAIGTNAPDSGVYLLSGEGNILWQRHTRGNFYGVGITNNASKIVAPSTEGVIYTYRKDGTLLNRYDVEVPLFTSVSGSGDRDMTQIEKGILARNASGARLWNFTDGDYGQGFAFSKDGNSVAYVTQMGMLYYLDAEGRVLWKTDTSGLTSLALSDDGSILVGGSRIDRHVFVWNRSGILLWDYDTAKDLQEVAISNDGRYISAASIDFGLSKLNVRAGEQVCSHSFYIFSSDGTILLNKTIFTRGFDSIAGFALSGDGRYISAGTRQISLIVLKNPMYIPPHPVLTVTSTLQTAKNQTSFIAHDTTEASPRLLVNLSSNISESATPSPLLKPERTLQQNLPESTTRSGQNPIVIIVAIVALALMVVWYGRR